MDMETIQLIQLIRQRPEIYIGVRSIWRLHAYIRGFLHAKTEGFTKMNGYTFNNDFTDWVTQKYYQNNHSWPFAVFIQSGFDETKALDIFFELFDEYLATNN